MNAAMLKLKVQVEKAIEPLIDEALKTALNSFAERHPREADRNGMKSITFRKAVAAQAAKYFAQRRGLARWRGIITAQDSAQQAVIDVNRHPQRGYYSHAHITSIQTELLALVN
jgi:hypothetical protein